MSLGLRGEHGFNSSSQLTHCDEDVEIQDAVKGVEHDLKRWSDLQVDHICPRTVDPERNALVLMEYSLNPKMRGLQSWTVNPS